MADVIQVGDLLPKFTLTLHGREFRPTPGKQGLLIYFMRTADCPVCRAHVRRLTQFAPELEKAGYSVLVIVPQGQREDEVAAAAKTPFPVVQGVEAHALMGLKRLFIPSLQQSGTVVANAQGRITSLTRSSLPGDSFDDDAVHALIERARPTG